MKVLHVIPAVAARYGGPSTAALSICRALLAEGVDVTLATTDADGAGRLPVRLGSMGEYEGVPTIFFARQFSESFKYSRPFSRWLSEHVQEFDCVHIHAMFSHSSLAAARACRRRSVPYIVRPLGSLENWSLRQKPLRKRLALALGVGGMLRKAAAIHYTTEREKRESEAMGGLPTGVVIPLGVDLTPALDAPPLSDLTPSSRTPLSMWRGEANASPPGQPSPPLHLERGSGGEVAIEQSHNREMTILFLSRLHPKKGVELLLEAFARVTARNAVTPAKLVPAAEPGAGVACVGEVGTTRAIPAFAGMTGEAAGMRGDAADAPPGSSSPRRFRDTPPASTSRLEGCHKLWRGAGGEDCRLVVAGSGDPTYESSLRRLADSLGIAERVVFAGWLGGDARAAAFAEADLFVLPSAQENFGLSVLEAMAAGVPVAVSRDVDLSDEVEAAGAGWVFERTEPALESALREALSDEAERRRRGCLGREAVEKRYRWPAIARELEGMYRRVLTPRVTSPRRSTRHPSPGGEGKDERAAD